MKFILLKWDATVVAALGNLDNVILITDQYDDQHFDIPYNAFFDHYHLSNFNNLEDVMSCLSQLAKYHDEHIEILNHTEYGYYACRLFMGFLTNATQKIDYLDCFRNKQAMKKRAAKLNIAQTPFYSMHCCIQRTLQTPARLPVVTKPLNGSGSDGVNIHQNQKSFQEAIRKAMSFSPQYLLVEDYVEGSEFHADALIHEGQVKMLSIAKYSKKPFCLRETSVIYSSILKQSENIDLYNTIETILLRYFAGCGLKTSLIHFEFFIDTNKKVIFSEIGARMGGGYIHLLTKAAFSPVDLKKAYIQNIKCAKSPHAMLYPNEDYYYVAANIRPQTDKIITALPTMLELHEIEQIIDFELPNISEQPFTTWGIMISAKLNDASEMESEIYTIANSVLSKVDYAGRWEINHE